MLLLLAATTAWPQAADVRPGSPPAPTLTQELAETANFLLRHGMSDPRGGRFGEAIVARYQRFGGSALVSEKGWYFPDRREIVLGDGLTYPVRTFLGPRLPTLALNDPRVYSIRERNPYSVWLAAALWLAAGDPDTALSGEVARLRDRPFENAALSYLIARYERALLAYAASELENALRDLRELVRIRAAFREEFDRRLTPEERINESELRFWPNALTHFNDLSNLVDQLLAECERRIRLQKRKTRPPQTITPQSARIAVKIEALDQAHSSMHVWPLSSPMRESGRVQDLIAEGEAALEPLLQAMETDTRLTITLAGKSSNRMGRSAIPVREAILEAIKGILGVEELPQTNRQFDLNKVRALWERTRGMSHPERWFAILQDDSASFEQWKEAIERLMEAQTVDRTLPMMEQWFQPPPTPATPRWAEKVRNRQNPSLTDLMVRRMQEMEANPKRRDHFRSFNLQTVIKLADWDPERALPSLQHQTRRFFSLPPESVGWSGHDLALATSARARLGDREALSEWVTWMRNAGPRFSLVFGRELLPLSDHATDPVMKSAAETFFAEPDGLFCASAMALGRIRYLKDVFLSPLITLEPLQRSFLTAIQDRRVVGSVLRVVGDRYRVELKEPRETSWDPMLAGDLPDLIQVGERSPVRVGDLVAEGLKQLRNAPRFHLGWTEARKDAALAEYETYLREAIPRIAKNPPPN